MTEKAHPEDETCADQEEWLAFNLGTLSADRARALERHLGRCPRCAALRGGLPHLATGDATQGRDAEAVTLGGPERTVAVQSHSGLARAEAEAEANDAWLRPVMPGEAPTRSIGPTTAAQLRDALVQGGFITPESIRDIGPELTDGATGPDARSFAESLVRRGVLTHFQAETLLEGRRPRLACGPYVLFRELGRGGMGVVYEALDRERSARVALKILPRVDPGSLYRFKREFRAHADLSHPNLIPLYELVCDADVDRWFFTMELVEGEDFLSYVRPGRERIPGPGTTDQASDPESGPPPVATPPDEGRLRAALGQLVEGLIAVHDAGLLHRDLKPSNVMVRSDGRVIILDFGLVTRRTEPSADRPRPPGGLAAIPWGEELTDGSIVGTIPYLAPELAAGRAPSAASDWYSVGVMLYESLTGRRPYRGRPVDVLRQMRQADPPRPSEVAPGVPEDLDALCMALLDRRPKARPTGRDVRNLLGPGAREPDEGEAVEAPRGIFVGRQTHMAILSAAYDRMRRGDTVTVLVHGRSGVGKSSLVQQFLRGLPARDDAVLLAGRCFEQESVPYKAIDSLVDALGRHLARLPDDEAEALLPPGIAALARVFPILAQVEAIARAPRYVLDVPDRVELRRRAFAALRELLTRIGARRPLTLAIDDLQWGDVDSARLLSDLLRPPLAPRLLLLAMYRSEYAATSDCLRIVLGTDGPAPEALHHLDVEPLTPDEARELARAALGPVAASAPEGVEAIVRESQGNPYFVYELAQHVRSGADLEGLAASGRQVGLDGVLWSRVQRLPAAARRLVEVISVAGQPLPHRVIFEASSLAGDERTAMAALRAGKLVRSVGPRLDDGVEAFHDRIRESVRAHLDAGTVRDYHGRLAAALKGRVGADPETLAVHLAGAGETEEACRYYAIAADQAAEALAFDRAAKLYQLAVSLRPPGAGEDRAMRLKLADALANAGRGAEAAHQYFAAARDADVVEARKLNRQAALQFMMTGHVDEGLEAFRHVLKAVGMSWPDSPWRVVATLLLRRLQIRLRGLGFRRRDAADIPAAELDRIDICWSAVAGMSFTDPMRAATFQSLQLLLSLKAGEPHRIARALSTEAGFAAVGGDRRRSRRLLESAASLAHELEDPYLLGLVELERGLVAYFAGEWVEGYQACCRAEVLLRDHGIGITWELDTLLTISHWALVAMGEVAELARRWPVVVKEALERGDRYVATILNTYLMAIPKLAADDPDGAERTLKQVMSGWSRQGFHVQHHSAMMAQVYIHFYRGESLAAWDEVTEKFPLYWSSMLARLQRLRIEAIQIHARSALAVAASSADPRPFLKAAAGDVARLRREPVAWAEAHARSIQAGISAVRGDLPRAATELTSAIEGYEAVSMRLHAEASRRRLGILLGGPEGSRMVADADAWMSGQGILFPARMAAMYTTGFTD